MFMLKKIISAFLQPVPIMLILLFLSTYFLFKKSYKKAKFILAFSLIFFFLISNQFFSNAILSLLENSHPSLLQSPKVNYILVLGNAHKSDEKLPITSQVKATAVNRLVEGVRHYQNLKNENNKLKLIVSGFSFNDENSHAQMQKRLALALGVKEQDIISLDLPKDTLEEAIEVKKILGDEKFILVTSASHMKRAMLLFKKQGLHPIASPTEHKAYNSYSANSFFNSESIKNVGLATHEYLGITFSYLKGDI